MLKKDDAERKVISQFCYEKEMFVLAIKDLLLFW